MVSTRHLLVDQATGRHAGGLKHTGLNPFARSFAYGGASSGCPSCNIGAMSNAGVGLNAYGGGCPRCGPGGCRCCG